VNKLLLNLIVPCIEKKFDVLIPDDIPISDVISLLNQAIQEQSYGQYEPSGDEVICIPEEEIILGSSYTFAQYGVKNGARIMLC
jgi:uncharacterized ubiquitin-like protein YukD